MFSLNTKNQARSVWVITPRCTVTVFLLASSFLSIRLNDAGKFFSDYTEVVFAVQILALLVSGPFLFRRLGVLDRKVILLLFVVVSFSFLSSLWSEYPGYVIQRGLLILIPSFGIYLVASSDDDPALTLHRIALLILAVSFILVSTSVVLAVHTAVFNYPDYFAKHVIMIGSFPINQVVYGSGWPSTFTSITRNPNTFAIWLLLSVFALKWLRQSGSINDVFYAIYLSLVVSCLWLSFSLGAILSVLTFFVLDQFLSAKFDPAKIFRARYAVLGLVLTVCAVILFRAQPNEFRLLQFFNDYNFGFDIELISERLWSLAFQWSIFSLICAVGIYAVIREFPKSDTTGPIFRFFRTVALSGVFIIVIISLFVFLPVFKVALYPNIFDEGLSQRLDVWVAMLEVFGAHPFFGVGFGVSGEWTPLLNRQNIGVFNSFFAILIELGFFGFLPFAAFLFLVAKTTKQAYVKFGQQADVALQTNDQGYIRYLICILAAFLLGQMFEVGLMRYDFLNFFIFAFLGFGVSFARKLDPPPSN
jgi:hypothetical protein